MKRQAPGLSWFEIAGLVCLLFVARTVSALLDVGSWVDNLEVAKAELGGGRSRLVSMTRVTRYSSRHVDESESGEGSWARNGGDP